MLKDKGAATLDLVQGIYPDEARRKKGAFAAIECFQNIPCNPCFSSCPRGAIKMQDINDLPKLDFDKCNGCGVCMGACPGLAIFVVDETYSQTETLIKLPYEFLPLPNIGDTVCATDREGARVCDGVVRNIVSTKNRTTIIWLSVPKQFGLEVRCISMGGAEQREKCECSCHSVQKIDQSTPEDAYVCRCEEITVSTIKELIANGYTTLDEIKRVSRAGMGACQGRTCRQLIMNLIAAGTGQKQENQPVTTFRPTVVPIKMGVLCKEDDANE